MTTEFVSTVDVMVDTLHAAGVPGFTYDPAVDPPIATITGCKLGGADFWSASCKPCWWWCEDTYDTTAWTPAEAQARADAHNAEKHPSLSVQSPSTINTVAGTCDPSAKGDR